MCTFVAPVSVAYVFGFWLYACKVQIKVCNVYAYWFQWVDLPLFILSFIFLPKYFHAPLIFPFSLVCRLSRKHVHALISQYRHLYAPVMLLSLSMQSCLCSSTQDLVISMWLRAWLLYGWLSLHVAISECLYQFRHRVFIVIHNA